MSDAPESRKGKVFTAYRGIQQMPTRSKRLYLAGGLLFLALVIWLVRRSPTERRVITRHGIATLRHGMSHEEVTTLFGKPLKSEQTGGRQCTYFGQPSLEVANFSVYVTCFEEGRLVEVLEKKFTASTVEPQRP